MTVSTTTARDSYTASASQTVFPYTFRILDESHIAVYIDDTLQTLTTHYTVSGVGDAGGGNITLVTPATGGENVTFLRAVPLTQLTDYTPFDAFPAETHETALDRLTMIAQQLDESQDRVMVLPPSYGSGGITLPAITADGFWKWNAAGTAIEYYDLSTLQGHETNAAASATAAAASATAAAASETAADADATATAADATATAADVVSSGNNVTYAAEWANKAEDSLVSAAAGGDEVDDYSAKHWSLKAAALVDAIPESVIDAKGDLVVGSADDTAIRLAVGTNDQVLTADSAQPGGVKWADAAGGSVTMQDFTASGTWTKPTGCTKVYVEVQGAGGGGGGGRSNGAQSGGGGSAGGFSAGYLDVSGISSSTITIGSAGSAGTGGNGGSETDGGAGGNSSWADGTNTLTGNGGGGGQKYSGTGGGIGTPGSASGGDVNLTGGAGQPLNAAASGDVCAHGGDAFFGKGGTSAAGIDATAGGLGAGGGGGVGQSHYATTSNAGAGGAGYIRVWEFYS